MEDLYGKSGSGQDPNAVSPMHLEDLVNSRPDLFRVAGRYEGRNAAEAPPNFDQQEIDFRAHTKTLEREQASRDEKVGNLVVSIQNTTKLIDKLQASISKSESLIDRFAQHSSRISASDPQRNELEARAKSEHQKLLKQQSQLKSLASQHQQQVETLRKFEAKEKAEYEKLSSELGIPDVEDAPPNPMH